MYCPTCASAGLVSRSHVIDTRLADEGRIYNRKRECDLDSTHVFQTQEALRPVSIEQVFVRGESHRRIIGKFSTARLVEDVRTAVLRRLPETELAQVAEDVVRRLDERLPSIAQPLSPDEAARFSPGRLGASILDVEIMREVEERLRQASDRSVHVLYALGARGRVTLTQRQGLKDATAFLAWLYGEEAGYQDLVQPIPSVRPRPIERWWPGLQVAEPKTVLKKSGRPAKTFGRAQFVNSIRMALVGRERAGRRAELIAEWVLGQVAGQDVVLSTQLSAAVTMALRRTDDIAYLRWTIVAKGYTSVRQVADEARALIAYPSPLLQFDPEFERRSGGVLSVPLE